MEDDPLVSSITQGTDTGKQMVSTSRPFRIHKRRLTGNFTPVDNALIWDKSLSDRAFRMIAAMQSLKPGTAITRDQLRGRLSLSAKQIDKVFSELTDLGFVTRTRTNTRNGATYEYDWYDQPHDPHTAVTGPDLAQTPETEAGPDQATLTQPQASQPEPNPPNPTPGLRGAQSSNTGFDPKTGNTLSRETSIEGRTAAVLSSVLGLPLTDEEGQDLAGKLAPPAGYRYGNPIPYLTTLARNNPELIREKHEQVTAPYNRYQPGPDFVGREVAAAW